MISGSEEMNKERLLSNKLFLDRFAGTWKGPESSEEILDAIKSTNTSKDIIKF